AGRRVHAGEPVKPPRQVGGGRLRGNRKKVQGQIAVDRMPPDRHRTGGVCRIFRKTAGGTGSAPGYFVVTVASPARRAGPSSANFTRLSARGQKLPSLSSTRTVTNERSSPSAAMAARSGVSTTRAGAPAVLISVVAILLPPW